MHANRIFMNTRLLLSLATIIAICLPVPTRAAEDWDFKIAPYLWTMSVRGKLGPAAQPANINMDFGDLTSLADAGFTAMGEATYKDNWTILGDFMYLKLSQDGTGPMGGPLSLDTDLGIYTLAGAKRVAQAIDIYAGARWFDVDSTARGTAGQERSGSMAFVDPIVGIRLTGKVSEKVGVRLATDFGGFGVGSDIAWHVVGTVNYHFSETWSGLCGYRALDVDYTEDDGVMALGLKGILLGLGISF